MSASRLHGWGARVALAVISATVTLPMMSLLGEFVVRDREDHCGSPGRATQRLHF